MFARYVPDNGSKCPSRDPNQCWLQRKSQHGRFQLTVDSDSVDSGVERLCGSHVSPELEAPHNIYLRRDGQPPHVMEDCFPLRDWRTSSPCYIIPMIRHTPPRTKIVMLLLCVSSPATEIPSSTMTKSFDKVCTNHLHHEQHTEGLFLPSPAELRSNFFFFCAVSFAICFVWIEHHALWKGVWDQLDYVNTVFANRPNVNSRPQDSRNWMSAWMSLCFGGVYYSHRSTLGTTASWGSMDTPGCCWDAPGWSVGPGWSLVLLLASQFHRRWHLFVLEPCRAEEADLALNRKLRKIWVNIS